MLEKIASKVQLLTVKPNEVKGDISSDISSLIAGCTEIIVTALVTALVIIAIIVVIMFISELVIKITRRGINRNSTNDFWDLIKYFCENPDDTDLSGYTSMSQLPAPSRETKALWNKARSELCMKETVTYKDETGEIITKPKYAQYDPNETFTQYIYQIFLGLENPTPTIEVYTREKPTRVHKEIKANLSFCNTVGFRTRQLDTNRNTKEFQDKIGNLFNRHRSGLKFSREAAQRIIDPQNLAYHKQKGEETNGIFKQNRTML